MIDLSKVILKTDSLFEQAIKYGFDPYDALWGNRAERRKWMKLGISIERRKKRGKNS